MQFIILKKLSWFQPDAGKIMFTNSIYQIS